MSDFVADLFDRVAEVYDESVPFFATFARRLVAWSNLQPGMRVLDLGAGRGAVSIAVVEALGSSCSILAVDISPEMIGKVEALRLPQVQARLLDAHALGLPDESFDAVLSGFVFHTLPDPATVLRQVARILTPTGFAALSMPGPSTDGGWWQHYGEIFDAFAATLDRDRPAGMTRVPLAWEQLVERAGLHVTDRTSAEVSLPIDGPTAHWNWLMSHGNRWLYDALDEHHRDEFRQQVLRSLRNQHPAQGYRLIAGAEFYKITNAPRSSQDRSPTGGKSRCH